MTILERFFAQDKMLADNLFQFFEDNRPYNVALVSKITEIVDPPRWAFWRKPVTKDRFVEHPERIDLQYKATDTSIRLRAGKSWTWDGIGQFHEFIVRTRAGEIVTRGGRLNTHYPMKGDDIQFQLIIERAGAQLWPPFK